MQPVNDIALHYINSNPDAAAQALESCSVEDRINFLMQLSSKQAAFFLPYLPNYLTIAFLGSLSPSRCFEVLEQLPVKVCAAYIRRFDESKKDIFINMFPKDKRKIIETSISYLPGTAGTLMDSSIYPVKVGTKISQVISLLKGEARFAYYVYIVDEQDKLTGVITLKRLIQESEQNDFIEDHMDAPVGSVFVDDEKQDILANPYWKKYSSLPVVDYGEKYLGVLDYETHVKLKNMDSHEEDSHEMNMLNDSLAELYGIGFSALIGSASSLIPKKGDL